ncbi:type II toxin-antitoxin system PemK/MazF family toxin [Rickettsiaceae bacterium]|nr:type II toxin-antitoxin system PemK/MazF family toxin [Rickettsiaceae bacterium]
MVEQKITRGGVYLAKLNPSKELEIGKVRPVIILNSQIILDATPPVIFICPLSSKSYEAFSDLHVKLSSRNGLNNNSFALVEHCRSISISRLNHPRISQASEIELDSITTRLQHLVGA